MVSWPVVRDRRGVTRIGCLLTLLVVVTVAYFGIPIAGMYIRYIRFENEMQSQASFAPSIDDGTILRRLQQKITELGLPDEARRIQINRTTTPREIRIATSWSENIVLPFYTYTITLRPTVRARM